jgi:hypothetical protein
MEPRQVRVNALNVVSEQGSAEEAAEVDFHIADLTGAPTVRRAFVLARVARAELPLPQKINFDDAARYL